MISRQRSIFKFADDIKLAARVGDYNGSFKLQMDFNVDKCKVLHVRRTNRHFSYTMDDKWLDTTDSEKELEVTINYDLKPHKQCLEARNKTNKSVGCH